MWWKLFLDFLSISSIMSLPVKELLDDVLENRVAHVLFPCRCQQPLFLHSYAVKVKWNVEQLYRAVVRCIATRLDSVRKVYKSK
jgi:hypothetical protein